MKKLFVFILVSVMLCGCVPQQEQPQIKWVTRITADYQKGSIKLHRDFTEDEKIRPVLDYFRTLSPYGTAQDLPQEGL